MKILATGDTHIGAGQDLGRTPGERLAEQEDLWADTLELARDREVDAVLHAGDLFHGRRPEPTVMLAAERPLVEHQEQGGATVYVAAGNHDVPSQDGPCGLDVLAEAGLIQLAREPLTWHLWDLSADPQRIVNVHALPWTPLSRLVAADGGDTPREELAALAADLLLETARGLYANPSPRKPGPSILLGHWSVSQTSLPNGLDVGSLGGVVLPMDDLQAIGFDALIFGHIHRPQQHGRFLYVGSPQPLDFGEAGCEHGCWLLETDSAGIGSEFVPLPSRPFVTIDFDLARHQVIETGLPEAFGGKINFGVEVPAAVKEGAFVKVRVAATEELARRFNSDDLRRLLEDAGAHSVWVEMTVERAHRERGQAIAAEGSRIDQLAAYLKATGTNGDVAPAMLERAATYLEGSAS